MQLAFDTTHSGVSKVMGDSLTYDHPSNNFLKSKSEDSTEVRARQQGPGISTHTSCDTADGTATPTLANTDHIIRSANAIHQLVEGNVLQFLTNQLDIDMPLYARTKEAAVCLHYHHTSTTRKSPVLLHPPANLIPVPVDHEKLYHQWEVKLRMERMTTNVDPDLGNLNYFDHRERRWSFSV